MTHDPILNLAVDPGNRWLFRWVMEFGNHKPTKKGGWYPASRFEDMAAAVNRDRLVTVMIEGKHFATREKKVFASIVGEDFINFKHIAVQFSRNGFMVNHVYGMTIVHRYGSITAYENGKIELGRELDTLMPESTRY
jgi:hypothetical protein